MGEFVGKPESGAQVGNWDGTSVMEYVDVELVVAVGEMEMVAVNRVTGAAVALRSEPVLGDSDRLENGKGESMTI